MPAMTANRFQRLRGAIEPWYNWGAAGISSVRDETGGDGWFFKVDWLGIHISVMFGRTPKAVR